jgi:hypothetical protein
MYTTSRRPTDVYIRQKKRAAGWGAYSGDPGSIGAGLCRILHPNFAELPFHDIG